MRHNIGPAAAGPAGPAATALHGHKMLSLGAWEEGQIGEFTRQIEYVHCRS